MSKKKITIVVLDIPCSNNKYQGRGGKREQIVEYQDEKTMWAWLVKAAIKDKPVVPFKRAIVKLTYFFPDLRRRDPDNYSGKFLLDPLVSFGIIEDDSFFKIRLILDGQLDRNNPRTLIEVFQL